MSKFTIVKPEIYFPNNINRRTIPPSQIKFLTYGTIVIDHKIVFDKLHFSWEEGTKFC